MNLIDQVRERLEAGAAILQPLLGAHGFRFAITQKGKSSGGPIAIGRFTRADQFLELHFRCALGIVTYGWGEVRLSHQDYMRELGADAQYPGFSDDPLDGFRHLLADLEGPALGFVRGEDRVQFATLAERAKLPRPRRLP
jgi:hypothetical protein